MTRAHSSTFLSLPTSQLILQPFVPSPTSQFILQPFFRFSYVTSSSLNSPGEPAELILQHYRHFNYVTAHSPTLPSLYLRHSSSPTLPLLHLRHSSFSNPSFASPTSHALHLIHLASRPCVQMIPGDECGPNFLTFVLQLSKNPGKTSTSKLTRPGIQPGPAALEV